MWIGSHTREPAKPSRRNSNPKIETLLSEGSPREEMSLKIGNQGSLKKAKSRPFKHVISHNFFAKLPCWRVSNELKSGTLSRARASAGGQGLCFFEPDHGEPYITVRNSGDFHIACSHPRISNCQRSAPRRSLKAKPLCN